MNCRNCKHDLSGLGPEFCQSAFAPRVFRYCPNCLRSTPVAMSKWRYMSDVETAVYVTKGTVPSGALHVLGGKPGTPVVVYA